MPPRSRDPPGRASLIRVQSEEESASPCPCFLIPLPLKTKQASNVRLDLGLQPLQHSTAVNKNCNSDTEAATVISKKDDVMTIHKNFVVIPTRPDGENPLLPPHPSRGHLHW